jgi:hypothetical protein
MRFKFAGNKADKVIVVIKNNDPNSTVIKSGAPTFFVVPASTTNNNGLEVAAADALASAQAGFFAGFNLSPGNMNVGDFGEAMMYGYFDYARVLLSTRATSTDVWASYAAIVVGDIMSFVTTSGVQAVQRSGAGSNSNIGWWLQAAQSLVSQTTQVSSVVNGVGNSTAMITQLRLQVRAI